MTVVHRSVHRAVRQQILFAVLICFSFVVLSFVLASVGCQLRPDVHLTAPVDAGSTQVDGGVVDGGAAVTVDAGQGPKTGRVSIPAEEITVVSVAAR